MGPRVRVSAVGSLRWSRCELTSNLAPSQLWSFVTYCVLGRLRLCYTETRAAFTQAGPDPKDPVDLGSEGRRAPTDEPQSSGSKHVCFSVLAHHHPPSL